MNSGYRVCMEWNGIVIVGRLFAERNDAVAAATAHTAICKRNGSDRRSWVDDEDLLRNLSNINPARYCLPDDF